MKRQATIAAGLATAIIGVVLGQPASSPSSRANADVAPQVVIASGVLRDEQGEPVANGLVQAYPSTTATDYSGTVAPVSTAIADAEGGFTLSLTESGLATLRRGAAANGGVANLDAVADDGGDMAGITGFSVNVEKLGSSAKRAQAAEELTVNMEAPALPARAAKRQRRWHCPTPGTIKKDVIRRFRRWVQVGEANNAYRDSNASFTYGRSADTNASKGISVNGGFFKLSGGVHVGNSHSAAVSASTAGRGQLRVFTKFKYVEGRSRWCDQRYDPPRHYQRFGLAPVRWIKRVRHRHQRHTLHRCPRKPKLAWRRHTGFSRTHHRFKRYHGGFSIGPSYHGWGITFNGSGTSGASEFARLSMSFGGGPKRHYVCGKHGKTAFSTHRVFSGARRR